MIWSAHPWLGIAAAIAAMLLALATDLLTWRGIESLHTETGAADRECTRGEGVLQSEHP